MPVCKIEEGTLEYASPPGWAQHRNRRWLIGLKVKQHKIGLPSHDLADTDASKPFHQPLTQERTSLRLWPEPRGVDLSGFSMDGQRIRQDLQPTPGRRNVRPRLSTIVRYWAWSRSVRRRGCTSSRSPAKRMRGGGQHSRQSHPERRAGLRRRR